MYTYNGNYPLVAHYIEDAENTQSRVPFKCRKTGETAKFFSDTLGGLADTGISLSLVTPKRIKYKKGSKVIIDGDMYSVTGIYPYIPDQTTQGVVKNTINAQYLVQLA